MARKKSEKVVGRNLDAPVWTKTDTSNLPPLQFEEASGPVVGPRKLLAGVLRVAVVVIFYNIFGIHWGYEFEKEYIPSLTASIGENGANILIKLFVMVVYVATVVVFVKGVYKIKTWNIYLDVFEGKNMSGSECSSYVQNKGKSSALEQAYSYRDSKMAFMDNESKLKFFKETSVLNTNIMDSKSLSYLNSKMAFMDNESRLDVLRGKK